MQTKDNGRIAPNVLCLNTNFYGLNIQKLSYHSETPSEHRSPSPNLEITSSPEKSVVI